MKNISKILSFLLLLTGVFQFSSCKKTWEEPDVNCKNPGITPNATISDLLALSPNGDIVQVESDMIFEGYVISSDEAGNYYKALVLQDAPENPTAGIYIVVDKRNMYVDFPVGKKVYVYAKGLFVGKDRGLYKLGLTYDSGYGTRIGRIPPSEADRRLIASCDAPAEIRPTSVTIDQIRNNGDALLNTLIQLNDVEFEKADLCSTFSLQGLQGVNKYLEDCSGNTLALRTSGYADFANVKVPAGKGTVTAVLGKYRSSYQVFIRDLEDLVMDGPRCDGYTPVCDASSLSPNASIAQVRGLLNGSDLVQITQDWIIEATITASDKSGNLYKAVYIADETGGIRLNLNMRDLYLRGYHRGAKLRIKLKDLYVGKRNGEIQLGDIYQGHIGNITDEIDQDHIFFTGETVQVEAQPVSLASLNYDMTGKLVTLQNVKFDDPEVYEYFALSREVSHNGTPKSANRKVVACDGSGSVTLRSSGYAEFANAHVRYGSGNITGILSCYDADHDGTITRDELQIYIRDIYDVQTGDTRCGAPYLLETFGHTTKDEEIDLEGWYNYAEAGTRKWTGGFWDGSINHYAQMSAYRSNEAQNIAWLISPPVAVTPGMKLSFQTAKAYWRHDALKVFVSTDFNGFDVRGATWEELDARIATDSDPNHAWIDSGDIDLSPYAGKVIFIGFRYKGSGEYNQTTTYRIDNVIIK